jgi:hypothetical protein
MTILAVDPAPAPVVVPAPAPADWRASLPEELKGEKSISSFKDVTELAKSHVEAQRMLGGSIRLPSEKDSPEERQKKLDDIYGKLGRPATAADYGIGEPEGLPEGLPWDMNVQTEFLGQAHKLGLTKDQALGVLEWYGERYTTAALQGRKSEADAVETMRKEWGGATERNIELARRVIGTMGGEKAKEVLNRTGLGNEPDMIRLFARVGKLLAEAQLISGDVEGIPTVDDAKKKIAVVLADPKHLYHPSFAGKPGHAEAVEEMRKLHELAYPSMA